MRPGLARRTRLIGVATALAVLAAACGGSSDSDGGGVTAAAKDCPGTPVKLMTITPLDSPAGSFPSVPHGAEAAAKAVTSTCELGRPLQIISCDDQFNPNSGAACGRRAVEEKVAAVAFSFDQTGDSYMPILQNEGIPFFGSATSPLQNSSPNAFPSVIPVSTLIAHVSAAAATDAKKVAIAYTDVPAVHALIDSLKAQTSKLGLTTVAELPLPPAASDMTQYAGQIRSSGADALIMTLSAEQSGGILKALTQQGADFDKLKVFQGAATMTPKAMEAYPNGGEGVYLVGTAWPADDTTNPGVAQFHKELEAAGFSEEENSGDLGLQSWAMVHVLAEELKGTPMTAAALLAKAPTLKIDRPEIASFDFSANAFPDDPLLSQLRMFTDESMLSRIIDGERVPVSDGFFETLSVPELTTG